MDHPFRYNERAWWQLAPEFITSIPGRIQELAATADDYYGGVEMGIAPVQPTTADELDWGGLREEYMSH